MEEVQSVSNWEMQTHKATSCLICGSQVCCISLLTKIFTVFVIYM
jgi:hypothetical protein